MHILFDEATAAHISEIWNAVCGPLAERPNHWHEDWDAPLAGLKSCYEAAIQTQSPEVWRAVVVQGRALRAALELHDGVEHRLYVDVTRLTDAVDQGMDALAKEGRGLVTPEQVERLIGKVQHLEHTVSEDRASRKLFEVEAKRTLDEVSAKVASAKKALVHLENVTLNPDISIISTGLAEAAGLITAALQFIESRELIERIKRAAEKVKQAGGAFFREVRARFAAFRLPWKSTPGEDYLTGSQARHGVAFLVRDGGKDREEHRVPGAGIAFQDCWLEGGKRICGPEMLVVPAGNFLMGSPPDEPDRESWKAGCESPQHKVTIAKPFAIGRFAVTFAEWDAAQQDKDWNAITGRAARRPKDEGWGRDDRPVIDVDWDDAKAYVKWLGEKTGKDYRLPSEAEWEYACRAGTVTPFWWGSSITPEQANYNGSTAPYKGGGKKGEYRQKTLPVKSFEPNPWGLYQVHGNVWECCEDFWHDNYNGAPQDGSAWTAGGSKYRCLRGGSWILYPRALRSACRVDYFLGDVDRFRGLRVARTLPLIS